MICQPIRTQDIDFTIIGQGLAGSLLAWCLLNAGQRVAIISDGQASASRVAAGLINPITGQRFVLADQTPAMLKHAAAFYHNIETKLGIHCYHPTPLIRLFNNVKEKAAFNKRLLQPTYAPFFSDMPLTDTQLNNAPFGGVMQLQAAWLDTNTLLDALHNYFMSHNRASLSSAPANTSGVSIHCEGYKIKNNKLFSWLPLQPAHGEILHCQTQSVLSPEITLKSKWILPTSEHTCRIGATFEPDILEPTVQDQSKDALLLFASSLKEDNQFKLLGHQAGIRPATLDKQPFIGFHPHQTNHAVFNGFGSRGSLLIPWYAKAFAATLLLQRKIPPEADIQRYVLLCA